MGDGGDVEEEIGGAAEGCVDDHGVADGGVGEDVVSAEVELLHAEDGAGGAAGGVEPDGLAGGAECGVREGEAEGFGDDLRGGGGAEELAASAGCGAGAAADLGGVFEGDLVLGEACADGLNLAGVFAVFGKQCDAAWDEDAGQRAGGGEGHHHCGEAFVAGGDADDAGAGGERAHETAKDDGCVVAVGQGVEHAGGALGATVAGVGAGSSERDGAESFEFAGGFGHECADLPVAGVEAESDGSAVFGAKAAVGAEDEDLGAERRGPGPSPCRRSC